LKTPVSHTGEQSLGDVLEPALGVIAFDAPVAKDASAPQTHADGADLAQIIHTGGTEWLPKGATLAHDAVIRQYLSPIADGSVKPAISCSTQWRSFVARMMGSILSASGPDQTCRPLLSAGGCPLVN
jgi:acyl-CoA synthetase (AMP-forming)/AMP-acid ligase II